MSTGEAGRVQASESTIRLILGLTATSPLPFRVPGDSAMSLVNRFGMYDFVHVRLRGETFVKGKGLLPTFWLEAKDAQHRTQTRTHTRSGAGSGVIPASARPGSLYYDRVSRDLKGRTETSAAGTVSAGAGGSGGRRTVSTGKPLGSTPRDVPARLPVVVSPRPDPRMMSSARASSRRALMGLPSVPRMPLDELVSASATDGPLPRASSSIPMHRSPMFVDPLRGAHRTLPGAVSIAEGGAATGIARYAVSSPGSTGALAIEPESDEARPGIEVEPHVGVMDTELSTVGEVVEVSPQRGDLMTNRGWMVAEQAAPALQTYAATVVAPSPIDEETARSDLLRDEPHDGGSVVGSGSYVHASSAAFLHAASTAVIVGDNAACEEPESDWQVWFRGTVLADILDVMRSGTWREALLLRFENHETEKRAARELFVHSLKGTTSALCVWLVCFITVLLLSSFLPGLGINHTAFSNALILPLAFTAVFGGASVAVQLFWLGDLSHAARRMLNRGMLVGSVVFVAALVWFCVGPGPSILLPRASAAFAGVSSDSGASPFEGQILLSLMIVAFLQCTAHMRLRVAHVALIGAICVALTLGFAASSITRSSGWPDNVVGLGVWAIFIAVSSNALTATMAAFAWEARCRTQVLMAAAARAAESEATELLKNLLPPTVVADNKAGRLTKPVLAHDVVILVSGRYAFRC